MIDITKLCAFDTSSTFTGWSIFINGEYNNSGTIIGDLKMKSEQRMKQMCSEILTFLHKEQPDIVVAEMTVVSRNEAAQRMLTMILGVIYCWTIENNKEFVMLRPSEWRALISTEKKGRKRDELKAWSVAKVKELYEIETTDDESDAILIGQALINKYDNM